MRVDPRDRLGILAGLYFQVDDDRFLRQSLQTKVDGEPVPGVRVAFIRQDRSRPLGFFHDRRMETTDDEGRVVFERLNSHHALECGQCLNASGMATHSAA